MLPFSIDRLLLEMQEEMDIISRDLVNRKFRFCNSFEKELDLEPSEYSQMIFDYIFNLFHFKNALGTDFKKYLEEFKDLDFNNNYSISNYLNGGINIDGSFRPGKYMEFVMKYKQYFMDYFGFNHEDPLYIQRKFNDNKSSLIQKLMEYS